MVLKTSTLQTEKSWYLANSLTHCSFNTLVGTATKTTKAGFALYNSFIRSIVA